MRGGVVDAGDQVMGFAVAKVPIERVLIWRTQRRKGERQVTKDRGRREYIIKKSNGFFFFIIKFRDKIVF